MKKSLLLSFIALFATAFAIATGLRAATLPTVSTAESETWYYIYFYNGGNVLTAQGDADICLVGSFALNDEAQQWKVEGDATSGYSFTNKAGQKLYIDKASASSGTTGFFRAAATPSTSYTTFKITATSDGANFLISPKTATSLYMNQFEGAKVGNKVGLWTEKTDVGSFVTFVEATADDALHLIPYPKSLTKGDGSLSVNTLTAITYPADSLQTLVTDFADQLKQTSGIALNVEVTGVVRKSGAINLAYDATLGSEAYTLVVDKDGISIAASTHAGFFYAIQTLKQMLPTAFYGKTQQAEATWTLPYVNIADEPELGYRGFHLDVARHFFDLDEVKRVLDIMGYYKLNRFHWHLTDDQGWRVEIPEYPLLTKVGAVRSGSKVNNSGFYDDTTYGEGMYYTLDQLRDIVSYAKDRGIEIIPEIDLPGHMVAAVTAYPIFGCHPDTPTEVRVESGISKDVLNIGKDTTIVFLKTVLGHIADVFPYKYIHLGGDECPTDQWTSNADCLKRVADEGLSGVNELQSWLVEKLGVWLRDEKGKSIIGWDEIMQNWHDANTIVPTIMQWNIGEAKEQVANTIAKGFSSIMVPYQTLYLDFYQVATSERFVNEGYDGGWGDGWVNSLDEIYAYNPLSKFTTANRNLCLGVQGNMWTETCNKPSELEYQMLPRLLALAEIGWLPNDQKSWISFLTRMQAHGSILDALEYNYAKHFFYDTRTTAEVAIDEAESLLAAATPGAAGYASVEDYAALRTALDAAKAAPADEATTTALTTAITMLKAAPIVQPTEGKPYQIVSASTYYKGLYDGSTMYESNGFVRFHYTPQTEPEELWKFVKDGDGYKLTSYISGNTVALPTYNANATSAASTSTAIRVDKATVQGTMKGCDDFLPGVVTLSAVTGYNAAKTGSVPRLYAASSGYVKSYDDPTINYEGTWRLIEVSDFRAQLEGLLKKATAIVDEGTTGNYGEPTEEAIEFLLENVVLPGQKELAASSLVNEETYDKYVALYNQYLAMPRKEVYDAIDEGYYYRIRNVYFSNYYAKASVTKVVPATLSSTDDNFLWCIEKVGNGKVKIYNKATKKAAYVTAIAQDKNILLGTYTKATEFTLGYNETAEASGVIIGDGTYSWYTNPNAFSTYLPMKPIAWGGSMWNFEKTTEEATGIDTIVTNEATTPLWYYELNGRRIIQPERGIFITNDGQKVRK